MRVPASFRQSGRKCSYRQGDYPAGIGILEDECLSDYNYEKDQTVQDHAGIQNHGFKTLSFFYDNFTGCKCQRMTFCDKQNDTYDAYGKDAHRVDGRDNRGIRFCLIQSHNDAAQNAAAKVDCHVQQDGIFETAGLYIDKGKKAAQKESVKELVKVHVEQTENQTGEYDCTAFPVLYDFVADQLAEQDLLADGRAKYRKDGSNPDWTAGYYIEHRVLHRGAFDQTDHRSETETDQVADDHDTIAHQEGTHKLPWRHDMRFSGRHIFVSHQSEGKREAQNVERHHSHDQKEGEIIPPLREKHERERLCAGLEQDDGSRADKHADADT